MVHVTIPMRVERKMVPLLDRSLSVELRKRNTMTSKESTFNPPLTEGDSILSGLANAMAIHPTARKGLKLNKVSFPTCEIRLWEVTSLLIGIPSTVEPLAHSMHPFSCSSEVRSWVKFAQSKPDGSSCGNWSRHSSVSGAALELLDGASELLCSRK